MIRRASYLDNPDVFPQTTMTPAWVDQFRPSLVSAYPTTTVFYQFQTESKHIPQVSVETLLVRSQLQPDI